MDYLHYTLGVALVASLLYISSRTRSHYNGEGKLDRHERRIEDLEDRLQKCIRMFHPVIPSENNGADVPLEDRLFCYGDNYSEWPPEKMSVKSILSDADIKALELGKELDYGCGEYLRRIK